MVKILGAYLWGRHSALSAPNHPKIGGDQLCGLCYGKIGNFCDPDLGIPSLPSDSGKILVNSSKSDCAHAIENFSESALTFFF